ncbi:MAG: TIR domain-containing protein, partial [Verrucomicrobia bacterium]|nr:TIR domain-containing protein [Verrucomicrobiota bacterium]
MRNLVYIGYSQCDKEWHSRLRQILDHDQRIRLWDDTMIPAGSDVKEAIDQHVALASIMVMLVSDDYLAGNSNASDREIKPALEAASAGELTIVPIPVRTSSYGDSQLKDIMPALELARPLAEMTREEQQAALEGVYHQILRILALDPRDFDVFLSHNSKDKSAVRELAQCLRGRGLKVWLDEWELPPGRPWQKEIEGIIKSTASAAVLVGRDGVGPWEEPEMRACLDEYAKRKLPIIPVLLPGAPEKPELPLFLSNFTWVDLRAGLSGEELSRLEWGITGKKREDSLQSQRQVHHDLLSAFRRLPTAYRNRIGVGLTFSAGGIALTAIYATGVFFLTNAVLPKWEAAFEPRFWPVLAPLLFPLVALVVAVLSKKGKAFLTSLVSGVLSWRGSLLFCGVSLAFALVLLSYTTFVICSETNLEDLAEASGPYAYVWRRWALDTDFDVFANGRLAKSAQANNWKAYLRTLAALNEPTPHDLALEGEVRKMCEPGSAVITRAFGELGWAGLALAHDDFSLLDSELDIAKKTVERLGSVELRRVILERSVTLRVGAAQKLKGPEASKLQDGDPARKELEEAVKLCDE